MLTKSSALVVRSLFVAAVIGSLVACGFEPSSEEDKSNTSSAITSSKKHKSDNDAAVDPVNDAGIETENDASCTKCDEDGGAYDNDGGTSTNDGGAGDGWYGDDDDATNDGGTPTNDGGAYDDRDAGF